jgi:hypothetical protein
MTDQLERARELMVVLREATEELSTLYGPLWHEREGLKGREHIATNLLLSDAFLDRVLLRLVDAPDRSDLRSAVNAALTEAYA